MEYRVTLKNHLKALSLLFILTLGLCAFVFYEKKYNEFEHPRIEFDIFILLVINILPVLYLHVEYYYYNKGTKLEIKSYEQKVIYTDKTGIIQEYQFDELSKIILCMPPHFHSRKMFLRIPFDTYHYAKIFTKNGKEIVITCLLVDKVQDVVGGIRGVPIERKKLLFSSILLTSAWR